ncbi:hypothetical protein M2R47_06785 [Moraxella sp. Tifton1]|uniref:Tetratricopeptide repeat protein n=1 Tax=Moraxella oculi TaxID=2940516 RepID=A0ABW8U7T7_9GAMM|nr:hypothetical protein [Moraxella sp. Tifton1]MCL1623943.1 hypothetical protein [Moraxella sp. Tifton1]
MKKLTAITLSLAMIGFSSAHANPKKTNASLPTIEPSSVDANKPLSPAMRGEITTTIVNNEAANLLTNPIKGLPTPTSQLSNIQHLPTVIIPANQSGSLRIDTTLIDDFISTISPNARHYPTVFPNATAEYLAKQNIKHLSDWIESYASAPDASFDVVLRAAKINGIARNLNVGTDYSVRASKHMQKALRLKPKDAEANFLFGMMLSESGGFVEGKKYLEKAASLGYVEAEQSLAQADLLNDNRPLALSRLKKLQAQYPSNTQIAQQIQIIEQGDYYIWQNDGKPVNIKPVQR